MRNEDRDWRNTEGNDARIARLAMRQHAVISYGQAIDAGLSRMAISRRVDAGRWVRLLPRVYRVGGAPATGRQGMMAATLWAGDGALLSHRPAGVLHGLDGVKAEHLEVTASKRLRSGVVLAHYAPPFTAIDRDVLDAIPHSGSAPEVHLRRLIIRSGLSRPIPQYEIRHRGRLIARVDLAYPELRVAIEYDSERWHSGRRRRESDLERHNRLTALGWHVVHVTGTELAAGAPTAIAALRRLITKE